MADQFCDAGPMGTGYVMNNGFQLSKGGWCMLYLFKGAVVDTPTKYAFALIGTLLLGISVELLRIARGFLSQRKWRFTHTINPRLLDVLLAFAFGVQMVVAYWAMLLIMVYESLIFAFLVVGLAIGHFITLRLQRTYLATGASDTVALSGSPCCCGDGAPVAPKVEANLHYGSC